MPKSLASLDRDRVLDDLQKGRDAACELAEAEGPYTGTGAAASMLVALLDDVALLLVGDRNALRRDDSREIGG